MDLIWLGTGLICGVIAAWLFVGRRNAFRAEERERKFLKVKGRLEDTIDTERETLKHTRELLAEEQARRIPTRTVANALREELGEAAAKLKKARSDHRKTKRRLKSAQADAEAAQTRADALDAELAKSSDKLSREKAALKETRQRLTELEAAPSDAERRLSALKAELADLRAKPSEVTRPVVETEIEELHAEIADLCDRLAAEEADRAVAEDVQKSLEVQLAQAHLDSRKSDEEASARLGDLQNRIRQQDALIKRLESRLAWVEVEAKDRLGEELLIDQVEAIGLDEEPEPEPWTWVDDPKQEKLAAMILDAAIHKSTGGDEGRPINMRDVLALTGNSGWTNKEAANRFMHAVSLIKSQVDEKTYRAVEAEAEQFYFTYTS